MPDKSPSTPARNINRSYWHSRVITLFYMAPFCLGLALLRHDASMFFVVWMFTGAGYLAAIPWVINDIEFYDPPITGWNALNIQIAGLAPWPLLWTTRGQFDDFDRRATVAAIIWLWALAAHWLARTSIPERRRRTIRAFLTLSAAFLLAGAGFAVRGAAPNLSVVAFAPAAAVALFAAYRFVASRALPSGTVG